MDFRGAAVLQRRDQRPSQTMPAQLSPEVWLQIFSKLQSPICGAPVEHLTAQANVLQLRLVCKAFHDTFDTCSALSAQLHLSSTFSSQSLPSLLTWFENHAKSVTSFKARCNSASLDVALGTMLCCRSKLLWVDCSNCVASSLILLSSLSSMTTCLLTDPQVHLNISPLQGLTKLQTLHLSNGTYTAAQLPMHLTEACFTDCNILAREDSACVTSLHKLQIVRSVMKGHHQGLPGFTALESLHCQDSCIPADDLQAQLSNWLGPEPFEMPADLSTLARLTTLVIVFSGKCVNFDVDISCLCSLTALEFLNVTCENAALKVTSSLTTLQALRCLEIAVDPKEANFDNNVQLGFMCLEVNWSAFHVLQSVHMSSNSFICDNQLLTLSQLPSLSLIQLGDFRPANSESHQVFAELVYCLALLRPSLVLILDSKRMSRSQYKMVSVDPDNC